MLLDLSLALERRVGSYGFFLSKQVNTSYNVSQGLFSVRLIVLGEEWHVIPMQIELQQFPICVKELFDKDSFLWPKNSFQAFCPSEIFYCSLLRHPFTFVFGM